MPGFLDRSMERMILLTAALYRGTRVTTAYIKKCHGVSKATAQRDMLRLECALPSINVKREPCGTPHPRRVLRIKRGRVQ